MLGSADAAQDLAVATAIIVDPQVRLYFWRYTSKIRKKLTRPVNPNALVRIRSSTMLCI